MEHIETIELGSSQSSITFSSIPQDYDDLVVVDSARNTTTTDFYVVRFNGSTTNLSSVNLQGVGSGSGSSSSETVIFARTTRSDDTANTFSNTSIYISNYTAAQNKSVSIDSVEETNATSARQAIVAGLWSDTSAITSIELVTTSGSFAAGCTFSLYGITAGGDGTVTTS